MSRFVYLSRFYPFINLLCFMKGNSAIFVMLSVCVLLEVLILALVCVHYLQWRRRTGSAQADGSGLLPSRAKSILSSAVKPLSAIERKYFILFMDGKSTEEIAEAMHVEPSSVYTMKYRIRKKFPEGFRLPF